ncbi:adenylosuccinate lyase [Candidatus Uhrbacteria bacterium]|nr:adenylosuccinate lyase [Candidatus Uhrbacteria bacterium]
MSAIWSDESKFRKWLEVELAVLRVREKRGELPAGTAEGIAQKCYVDRYVATGVNNREKVNGHDLNAFVELMRVLIINPPPDSTEASLMQNLSDESITVTLAKGMQERWDHFFHEGMTSYDTEEPAMALLLGEADRQIMRRFNSVSAQLRELAGQHRGTLMIGRTHGQWAQPVTFGKRCLDWLGGLWDARDVFEFSSKRLRIMKLSGAVGMYGTFGPEIEAQVAQELDLVVARIATQIMPLGRKAHHMASLALIASEVEKIARDLWLLSQSEIGEVQEPFGKKQKGSSAMPHKKNPITFEKMFGLPRAIRGYMLALFENVATAHERDISHSSVERVSIPEAYAYTEHLQIQLERMLGGLQVFPERMLQNLEATKEVYASQVVRDLLGQHGVAGETAYRFIQTCSQIVREKNCPFSDAFLHADDVEVPYDLRREIGATEAFDQAFDPKWWVRHEDVYYQRFGF